MESVRESFDKTIPFKRSGKDSVALLSQPSIVQITDYLEDIVKDLPKDNFSVEDFLSHSAKDTVAWSADVLSSVKILPADKLPGKFESEKWNNLYKSVGGGYYQPFKCIQMNSSTHFKDIILC